MFAVCPWVACLGKHCFAWSQSNLEHSLMQVRYESRRRLAEARPRVRGQFVKAGVAAAHNAEMNLASASASASTAAHASGVGLGV
jgi:hypothetical protein